MSLTVNCNNLVGIEYVTASAAKSREVQELRLLQQISSILDQHPDINQVLLPVLDALAQHMDLRHGTVTLLNRKTGDITIDLAHGMSQSQVSRGRYKLGDFSPAIPPFMISSKQPSPLI